MINKRISSLSFVTGALLTIFLGTLISCKKYLDKKPQQNLTVPSTLADLEAVLNQGSNLNNSAPSDLDFVADEYYLSNGSWQNAVAREKNLYIWDKNAEVTNDEVWKNSYQSIFYSNFVIDQLPKVQTSQQDRQLENRIKGTALFLRSFYFHELAQIFCRPYSNSASTDLGIVLRLTSDVTTPSTRATVQQCYDQVVTDLKSAASLLPISTQFVTQPNKAAAYGMLSRVYLSMRDYLNAGKYADSCLSIYNTLIDYQQLNFSVPAGTSVFPFVLNNPEILFLSVASPPADVQGSHLQLTDTLLYQSYDINDLRQKAFYAPAASANTYYWNGSYANSSYNPPNSGFHGIATDEIYLIRAECKARTNDAVGAMQDLTTLMHNRYRTGTYTDTTAINAADALLKILRERRKELVFRGVRWSDLRRFNLEGSNITLTRIVNGTTYTLPPNDLRWVLLIPSQEISRSGIQQNPR